MLGRYISRFTKPPLQFLFGYICENWRESYTTQSMDLHKTLIGQAFPIQGPIMVKLTSSLQTGLLACCRGKNKSVLSWARASRLKEHSWRHRDIIPNFSFQSCRLFMVTRIGRPSIQWLHHPAWLHPCSSLTWFVEFSTYSTVHLIGSFWRYHPS